MKITSKLISGIIIYLTLFFSSCDEYMGNVNCDECYTEKPDSADLIIHLTINSENRAIPLTIYKGSIENGDIEWLDTAHSSPYYCFVQADEYYSVKAEYKTGNRKIYVVDGDKLLIKHVSESCGSECWVITGGILKTELKFDGKD